MKHLIFTLFLLFALACDGKEIPEDKTKPDPTEEPGDNDNDGDDENGSGSENDGGGDEGGSGDEGGGGDVGPVSGSLVADGNDAGTYALIDASGYNYETPDTSGAHASAPFRHITQSFDQALGKNVFNFIIHVDNDDDRGILTTTDRQRNEIKTDNKSPKSMWAQQEGETLVVKWKFKLPAGMLTTKNFCHIHQIKGIDNKTNTADVGNPVITFTCRSVTSGGTTTQQFQVIYVGRGKGAPSEYLSKVKLADFLEEWVTVEERITFGEQGTYQVKVVRNRDSKMLVNIASTALDMWREGATGMRPKWGIYRYFGANGSLKPDLRDEMLKYADFSVEKVD